MSAYFDHNATTELHPAAREAWLKAMDKHWQNPSSLYREAGYASQALESARERLADLMGAEPERIVFTSGATESNNTLFAGLARCLSPDAVVAISAIEHPSVREAARGPAPSRRCHGPELENAKEKSGKDGELRSPGLGGSGTPLNRERCFPDLMPAVPGRSHRGPWINRTP